MERERLWNRNYCKVMVANFTLFFAFYILTPLLPLYLSEHFGATKDVIGLVLSGYTITALLFRPFSGYVVDAFPRKAVLMISFGAFAIFFAGYLAASTLLLFTIVRTLHGGPFGALTVSNSTVAIDVLPSSRRTEGIGYYGLSNNLAMAIAPTIGIFIYKYTQSFELLFWLALVVACAGWIVDATVRLDAKAIVKNKSKFSWDRFFLVRGWLLGLNMVAFGFSFGVLSNYLAIYGKEVMGITGGTGTYFMLCSVGLNDRPEVKPMGMGWYQRDIFLDNQKTRENYLAELKKGLDIANKKGHVIMIGHVWSAESLPAFLEEAYPELALKGYRFSTVSKSGGMYR